MKSKTTLVVFLVGISVFLAVVGVIGGFALKKFVLEEGYWSREKTIGVEDIGSNAQILTVQGKVDKQEYTAKRIRYSADGRVFESFFDPQMKAGLEWIKSNTNEDSVFLSWWDYGHMIRGYAGREVIVYSPSPSVVNTIASRKWDTKTQGEFSGEGKITDTGKALLTENPEETSNIMKKYGANYLLVHESDTSKFKAIYYAVNKEFINAKAGEDTVLYKAANKEEINGLSLVYSDEYVSVYGI